MQDVTVFSPISEPADSSMSKVDMMKDARRLYP